LIPNSSSICRFNWKYDSLFFKTCRNFNLLSASGSDRQILQRSKFSLCKSFILNDSSNISAPAKLVNVTVRKRNVQTSWLGDETRRTLAINEVSYNDVLATDGWLYETRIWINLIRDKIRCDPNTVNSGNKMAVKKCHNKVKTRGTFYVWWDNVVERHLRTMDEGPMTNVNGRGTHIDTYHIRIVIFYKVTVVCREQKTL